MMRNLFQHTKPVALCSIRGKTPHCLDALPLRHLWAHPPSPTQSVLICGWGETSYMCDLLGELDHGPSALAPGSQVTLFNTRDEADILSAQPHLNVPTLLWLALC